MAPAPPRAATWRLSRPRLRPAAVLGALGAAAVAAIAVPGAAPGLGLSLTALVVLAVATAGARGRFPDDDPARATLLVTAALLALTPFVRDAGWLVTGNLVLAAAFASAALTGGRGWRAALAGPLALWPRLGPGLLAVGRGIPDLAPSLGRTGPALRGTVLAAGLLGVFGALLASADSAFAHLTAQALPSLADLGDLPARSLAFLAAVALTGGLLLSIGSASSLEPSSGGPLRLEVVEATTALTALVSLFAAFVAVQLVVLFGGEKHVLGTAGLTYAEYAHQGFAQLLIVAVLVLAVVAAALRWADQGALVRPLLVALCALTLVVVASALHRLDIYVDAFGATRLRLDAAVLCAWIGALLALVSVRVAAGRGAWLPRGATLLTAAFVLAFTALDPDGYVAHRNVERFERTDRIDAAYLRGLSDDAAPALGRLPSDVLPAGDACRELEQTRGWASANLARSRAREALCGG